MNQGITIGVDLAKNVFRVHGVDADGAVPFRRQSRRRRVLTFFKKQPPCLVGIGAVPLRQCLLSGVWCTEPATKPAFRALV